MTDVHRPAQVAEVVAAERPAPRGRWRTVYESDPFALVSQSPGWMDVLTATHRWHDASVLLTTGGGRELVVPLAGRFGDRGLQASFGEGWGMGGVLAKGGPTPSDVATVFVWLRQQGAMQIGFRPNPALADVWHRGAAGDDLVIVPKVAHLLDLGDRGADAVFSERLSRQARRNVRRAERLGVEVETDGSVAAVRRFSDLMRASLDRWAERSREPRRLAHWRAARRDPLDKFLVMARVLGDRFRLHIAYVDEVPAAAAIVLVDGRNAHYTRGVMDVAVAGRTNASDHVQWAAIRDAVELGCSTYHMGDTGTHETLAHFKEKFGAEPVPYAQYRIERLPLTAADAVVRSAVKRLIGFRDA